jgi:rhodanese-related sulfurtransferase
MKKLIVLFAIAMALSPAYAQQTSDVVVHVSVPEFSHLIDSLEDEVVIDLRTPDELKQGKIANAIVIDYFGTDFEAAIQKLDRNKTYLLYCAGGSRSGDTAELMRGLGFRKVYDLEPGFNGWVKKKMPIQK